MANASRTEGFGHWRFVLRPMDGSADIEVSDVEPNVWGERLDLLTVLRALESLDQPSRVTLIGCTRYVEQGIQYGIEEWRANDWRWECFGQMVPVRDADLWQRMEQVLHFHRVECGKRRFDRGHDQPTAHHWGGIETTQGWIDGVVNTNWAKCCASVMIAGWVGWTELTSWFLHKVFGYREQKAGVY